MTAAGEPIYLAPIEVEHRENLWDKGTVLLSHFPTKNVGQKNRPLVPLLQPLSYRFPLIMPEKNILKNVAKNV